MHKQVSVDNVQISISEGGCSYDVCLCGKWQGRSTTGLIRENRGK